MRRVLPVLLVLTTGWWGSAAYRTSAPPPGPFPDVPAGHWGAAKIRTVALDHDWLRDYGTREFRPGAMLARRQLARAIVLAFAPPPATAGRRTFRDLPDTDPSHRFAARAVALGWMGVTPAGNFLPNGTVTKADLALVLAKALGLRAELAGLDAIATQDGRPLIHPRSFAALAVAGSLRLFRNHSDEARELLPSSIVPRDDAAHALEVAAAAAGTWRIRALERFRTVRIPVTEPPRRRVVEFALAHVGYPYVKAGEWPARTPRGYCCGAQPQGGFDCSGLIWWVMRERGSGYDPGGARPYPGWPLAERSSARMAQAAAPRISPAELQAGDLVFSDVDGRGSDWQAIDHVGMTLGGGWMIHASSPGVLLDWIAEGWWAPRVRYGRGVISAPPETPEPTPTPSPTTSGSPSPQTPSPSTSS